MGWYEFDENEVVSCKCGWSGPASAGGIEFFGECFSYECPECGRTLAVFSYPLIEETKRKAAEGNEKAQGELQAALGRESFMERAKASELERPDQLPDLDGDGIIIEWDFEDREKQGGDCWTVLRHNGREIWREVAYYEGGSRYHAVATILIERYGTRLAGFPATEASKLYLYGDDWRSDPVGEVSGRIERNRKTGTE